MFLKLCISGALEGHGRVCGGKYVAMLEHR